MKNLGLGLVVIVAVIVLAVISRIAYVNWINNSEAMNSYPTAILFQDSDGIVVGRLTVENNSLVYSGTEIGIDVLRLETMDHKYATGGYVAQFWGGYYWDGIQSTSIDKPDFLVGLYSTLEGSTDEYGNYTIELEY